MLEGVAPSPGAGLGIAAPQGRETPAGAGRRMVASNEAQKRARGPAPEFALKELRTSPGAPELPSAARKFGVGLWGELKGRVAPRSSSQSIRDPKGRANALELDRKKEPRRGRSGIKEVPSEGLPSV